MYPHQTWIGENKNKVIIKNQSPTHPAFATYANYPPTGQLDSFQMHNMTLQADNPTHATVMFAPGTKNCVFKDNIFRAPHTPSDSSFIVYWNVTYGGNDRMTFRDNLIEGSTNGQDMFGSGVLNDCDISNNWFVGINDGQGIGVTAPRNSKLSFNHFFKTGNPIGMENYCEGNSYCGNILENCIGWLKLSHIGGGNFDQSIGNLCANNILRYGATGIEDGMGIDHLITNNLIYRTQRYGIIGCFNRCEISHNHLIETNHNNYNTGGLYTDGGIELQNNAHLPQWIEIEYYPTLCVRNNLPS